MYDVCKRWFVFGELHSPLHFLMFWENFSTQLKGEHEINFFNWYWRQVVRGDLNWVTEPQTYMICHNTVIDFAKSWDIRVQ